mmetsp:Transcript_16810/g.27464  ORF Transcript_16810/g.27464 Transcript_16810/m.27464 type:complete len:213 (-) Transcript_16810:596-1234(-)
MECHVEDHWHERSLQPHVPAYETIAKSIHANNEQMHAADPMILPYPQMQSTFHDLLLPSDTNSNTPTVPDAYLPHPTNPHKVVPAPIPHRTFPCYSCLNCCYFLYHHDNCIDTARIHPAVTKRHSFDSYEVGTTSEHTCPSPRPTLDQWHGHVCNFVPIPKFVLILVGYVLVELVCRDDLGIGHSTWRSVDGLHEVDSDEGWLQRVHNHVLV